MSDLLPASSTLDEIDIHVTNLPFAMSPLIGRQAEVAWLAALLQRSEVRLVTLSGAGGSGKTRLALQVASTLFHHFVDGIYFVDLVPLQEPALVLSTIMHTLALTQEGEATALQTLKYYLRTKRVLLLLDNFEHLQAAAPLVGALLAGSTALKVLVTSRSTLHLSGEHEYPVLPLAVPDLAHLPPLTELAYNPAVALFTQRARAVRPDFQLNASNAATVAELCVRLDGLPLALELAAGRSKMLSPQALLAWLAAPLQLLTGGARDLPARQRTLRATIEWSHNSLDEQEQRLFRRLAVFVGGCTLEAIANICYDQAEDPAPDSFTLLELVGGLVEKNLLVRVEQEDGEARFKFLELIWEYARERLAESGENVRFQQRHLVYFLALAEDAEPKLTSHEQLFWLAQLEQEHDNLRAALAASGALQGGTVLGLRLASALWWFWMVRGYVSDWRHWLEPLLAATNADTTTDSTNEIRAVALQRTALLLHYWDSHDKAQAMAQQSLELANALGDSDRRGWAHYTLGEIAVTQAKLHQAQSHLVQGLTLFRSLDDRRGICWSLQALGWIHLQEYDYAEATRYFQAGLAEARALGDRFNIGSSLYNLGAVFQTQERFDESDHYLNESLQCLRIIDSSLAMIYVLISLASTAQRRGNLDEARRGFVEGLQLAEKLCSPRMIAYSLGGLAAYVAAQGQFELAAQLFACADAHAPSYMLSLDPGDRVYYYDAQADVRAHLGETVFQVAWQAGASLMPSEALAHLNTVVLQSAPPLPSDSPVPRNLPAGLSQREAEVLRLLAQGLTNAEMAEKLIVSPFTVNAHLRNIYNKIGTSVRRDAIRFAHQHNLV